MKKKMQYLFLFTLIFLAANTSSAKGLFEPGVDPHDSLLFDDGGISGFDNPLQPVSNNCFVKVKGMNGVVTGEVIIREIVAACGGVETLYVSKIKKLEIGDILVEGTTVLTSKNSWVGLGIYLSTDESSGFPSTSIIVSESSELLVPRISDLCKRLEAYPTIPIIKGIVTYENETKDEDELAPLPKFITKGKRSTGKHKKTRYSHEVKITESDTVDVIRVYKGSVEITFMMTDRSDEDAITKDLEKMNEDMQAGKLTMEEIQAKMTEFQSFGNNLTELMQPINVDEGSKCTITKNSRIVEPLGAGDEDHGFEQ